MARKDGWQSGMCGGTRWINSRNTGTTAAFTEDQEKQAEKDLQKLTDDYIAKIDQHLAHKEKEIMTV